jgi:hypothetical protein
MGSSRFSTNLDCNKNQILMRHTNTKYYLGCSYPLEAGSVVLPGNWGRIVGMYNTSGFGNPWIQFREDVFEKVRRDEYSKKPSRLKSIFLCESPQSLQEFLQQTNRGLDFMYGVTLIDQDEPIHRGCLSLLDIQQRENPESFMDEARNYWSAASVVKPEIATTSRVRIDERI